MKLEWRAVSNLGPTPRGEKYVAVVEGVGYQYWHYEREYRPGMNFVASRLDLLGGRWSWNKGKWFATESEVRAFCEADADQFADSIEQRLAVNVALLESFAT